MFLKGLGHEIDFKKLFLKFEVYATRFKFSEAPCNLSKTMNWALRGKALFYEEKIYKISVYTICGTVRYDVVIYLSVKALLLIKISKQNNVFGKLCVYDWCFAWRSAHHHSVGYMDVPAFSSI